MRRYLPYVLVFAVGIAVGWVLHSPPAVSTDSIGRTEAIWFDRPAVETDSIADRYVGRRSEHFRIVRITAPDGTVRNIEPWPADPKRLTVFRITIAGGRWTIATLPASDSSD